MDACAQGATVKDATAMSEELDRAGCVVVVLPPFGKKYWTHFVWCSCYLQKEAILRRTLIHNLSL